jgi:uncharacterized protein (DUF885 family)
MTGQTTSSHSPLARLYHDYWEFFLGEFPTYATYLGDHRYDDKLEDVSEAHYHSRIQKTREFLDQLHSHKKPSSPADRLNYELFERELSDKLEESKFEPFLQPISQQEGPHIDFPQIITYHPFNTPRDFENYLSRLHLFPRLIDQLISCMDKGITRGIAQTKIVVEKTVPQMDAHIVENPDRSEFYKPFTSSESLKEMSDKESQRLRDEAKHAILSSVVPSYRKLRDFVAGPYLKGARKEEGIWFLHDGKERYEFCIRHHTTTSLSPDQIHQIGLDELKRIHTEIRGIMTKAGFKGSIQDYANKMRNDRSMYYSSASELLAGFRAILRKMDAKLPELFGRLPKAKYDLREIESYRADSAPDAYYYPPPEDGSRPAYFYVNTFRPETRPKYTMEALAYHEAVPGHHLQIAIQQELDRLPMFRRYAGYSAFVEGWALYSERLPKEIGFYQTLESDFGRLTLEAWRAARLVVDTGIHSKHWTRDMAIRFMEENTALSGQNVVSEVDRYIAWPGQALAYKIGERKISELRSRAEKNLGTSFNLRSFHDELLNEGALALDVLESKMNIWLDQSVQS